MAAAGVSGEVGAFTLSLCTHSCMCEGILESVHASYVGGGNSVKAVHASVMRDGILEPLHASCVGGGNKVHGGWFPWQRCRSDHPGPGGQRATHDEAKAAAQTQSELPQLCM